jgi:hypothetical protein
MNGNKKQSNPSEQTSNSTDIMVKDADPFEISNYTERCRRRDYQQSGSHDCKQGYIQQPSIPKTIHVKFVESSDPSTGLNCTNDRLGR